MTLNNKTLKNEIETQVNWYYGKVAQLCPLNNKTLKNEIETRGLVGGAERSNLETLNNKTLKNEIETRLGSSISDDSDASQ